VKIRAANLLPLLLVLFLAGLTLWLRIAVDTPTGGDSGRHRHDPDAIVEGFTVTRLNERGTTQYSLTANRMIHYADDDTTELTAPQLVRRGDGPPITITSERGNLTHNSEEAFFHDNVLVVREATPEQQELRLRTSYLHLLAEQGIARTPLPVTITEGRSVLSGVGMEFNKESRRFALLSHVRGNFAQAKR
jgi:lipopolysaccharide export system protein LptC